MSTLMSGSSLRIWRVASRPLSVGMAMSMSTTSGRSLRARPTAWRPVSASPTTAISCSASSNARKPRRTTVWSSASSTFIFCIGHFLLVRREWNFHAHARALAGRGRDGETAIDQPHALLHPHQPEAFFTVHPKLLIHWKRFAVVLDLHLERTVVRAEEDLDAAGLRMAGHVGQAFLRDAEHHGLLLAVQILGAGGGVEAHSHAVALGKLLHAGTQRGQEAEVVQNGRAQFAREVVHDVHRLPQE